MPSVAIQNVHQPLLQGPPCQCLLTSVRAQRSQQHCQQHCQRNVQSCWDQWWQNEPLTLHYHFNPTLWVDEQLIMEHAGHRSLDGVRSYQKNQWWTEGSTVWHCKPHCSRHNETQNWMLYSLQLVVNSSLKCCKFLKDKCLHCCVSLVWPSAWLLLSQYKPTLGLTTTKWLHLLGISLQIKNVPSVVLVQAYLSLLERVWPLDWLGFNRVCVLSQYKPSKYVVVYTCTTFL